jgi:hypothetical protein
MKGLNDSWPTILYQKTAVLWPAPEPAWFSAQFPDLIGTRQIEPAKTF